MQILDPNDEQDALLIAERGYPASVQAVAYVCIGQTCSAPIMDADVLKQELTARG